MNARERLKQAQEALGISPKKSLGQNFLVSDHAIDKIIRAAARFRPQSIVEVGPGLGALTWGLKELVDKIQLIELDAQFANYWREQNFNVTEVDALQWDWDLRELPRPCVLVSNLPYQISSSLVIDRSEDQEPLDGMVLMFQKEVAQRLKAKADSSDYGFLSVVAQTFWDLELLLEASPREFSPAPRVASRVLIFNPRQVSIENRRNYVLFLKAAFLHPRKLMLSNLVEGLGKPKEFFAEHFAAMKIDPQIRAGQVRLAQFMELYSRIRQ